MLSPLNDQDYGASLRRLPRERGFFKRAPGLARPGFLLGFGLLLACAFCSSARAQIPGPVAFTAQSVSGQFTVLIPRGAMPSSPPQSVLNNTNYLQLDPMLLPSSCERLKQAVWRILGSSAPWRGQIFLALHPATGPGDTVTVISQRFETGWQYRVEMPDTVQRTRYARALVEVVLQEIANRTAGQRAAEIPAWLTEGMTRQVLATSAIEIMLQAPHGLVQGPNGRIALDKTDINRRRVNPLAPAHRDFRSRPPLTFEELSWPTSNQLNGPDAGFYADSAQLFLDELLRLPYGRARLLAMVQELPQRYNWQFAFLHAFGAFFQRPLDVEKWWALQAVQFTGHELTHTWTEQESWGKLDQAIRSAVEIRTRANQLPLSSEISLQTIVKNWDYNSQAAALQNKLHELEYLRPRLARDHAALAADYEKVIQTYLESRDHSGFFNLRKSAAQRQAAETALRELGMLDTRRLAFKPKTLPEPKLASALQAQAKR